MTKVYCGKYSCRFCLGEVCTKNIISVKDDGTCNSYRGEMDNVWSYYDKQPQSEDLIEQQRKRMRLLREDKISKDDVN